MFEYKGAVIDWTKIGTNFCNSRFPSRNCFMSSARFDQTNWLQQRGQLKARLTKKMECQCFSEKNEKRTSGQIKTHNFSE